MEARALRSRADQKPDRNERLQRQVVADRLEAEALIRLNRPVVAKQVIDRALRILARSDLREAGHLRGLLLLTRGGVAAMSGRIADALKDYQRAHDLLRTASDHRNQALALLNIGSLYYDASAYETALRYYAEAMEAYHADPQTRLSAYNNQGNALFELKRYGEAEVAHKRALQIAQQQGNDLLQVVILQNIASTQAEAGKFTQARQTLDRAFQVSRSGPAAAWRPALYGVSARAAFLRGDLVEAKQAINETFGGASKVQAAMPLRDFHQTAYQIYRRTGDAPKALEHLEAFKKLDDEARSLAASTSAALMSARFDFANQNMKIAALRTGQAERDATIARANVRFQNALTAGLLSVAAIIMLLLSIGFFSIRRSRNQVRAANASLTEANAALNKALAAKTEFLATTSHEIRTPLNGMLGMTQVILAGDRLDPAFRSRIELIQGAGETMRALVDDILDMAKIETGELRIHPAEMDLHRLLTDAVQVWSGQAETKGITIALELGDSPARIVADEVRLRQIIFNLMSNAVKFTDRGRVRLMAVVAGESDGEVVRISVEDSGVGIPADRAEDIFESFRQVDSGVTRRHGGTGLGLAICRNLARQMGGDVTMRSVLGAGATFTLALPLVRADVRPDAQVRTEVRQLADADLLVVDGNPLAQGVLRAALAGQTAGLTFVANFDRAIAHLQDRGADHVLADGVALELDMACAIRLAEATTEAGGRFTLLWPSPSPAQLAEFAARNVMVLAKPISVAELLPALRNRYGPSVADTGMAA
jgi:signal transduction histidine kinase/CheY-like chemotaxis protein